MRCALLTSICLASLLAACAPEGSSAYVSKNLLLDSDCKADVDSDDFLAAGLYDLAAGYDWNGKRESKYCSRSYYMHLAINSNLKANANSATGRAEPNVLQITEAEVRLIDIQQQTTIELDESLPNPFRVKANITLPPSTGSDPSMGVVPIETIPAAYKSGLGDYVNEQIMAEVQIFGTTLGDVDIDFKPFSFPITLCRGCLVKCRPSGLSDSEIYGDACPDNAGADDRICLDANCPAP